MITGIGGIFIKASDPKFLARWYEDNLGIGFGNTVYFSFKWREKNSPGEISHTVLSMFKEDSTYFYPGTNDVMLNLRVNNLDDLRIRMKNDGAFVEDKVESYEYGRFGWALDPAGNKIELWEPVDDGFEDRSKPMVLGAVRGLAGINIKSPVPESLCAWYSKQFGLFFQNSVHVFENIDLLDTGKINSVTLGFYPEDSSFFHPSSKEFMLSFYVNDILRLLDDLRTSGIIVSKEIEFLSHGKFGWAIDPDGNKIELCEPV
jgi:predicted enzyme related to lactoylglutathione lyase